MYARKVALGQAWSLFKNDEIRFVSRTP